MKALVAGLLAAALLAAGPAPAAGTRWGAGYFPNVELTAHDGRKYRLYDDLLKGKTVAINVIFTDCKDVCPLETAMLVQLHRLLGDRVGRDIAFYSISIDPERDTPAVLKAYAEKFGALLPGWLFLTGKPEDIRLATKKLGLVRGTDKATRDGHTAILMVGRQATGQWDRMSALDDSRFLATRMAALLGWRDVLPVQSYAQARPIDLKTGQYVYQGRCSACHTIGLGDKVGPDLAGVGARRGRAWLARYIGAPDEVLAEGDAVAAALYQKYGKLRMPKLRFAPGEVDAVIDYVEARSAALVEKAKQHAAQPHQHGHPRPTH
ncbi:MAG: SCO family protein [Burkholderiales bacterium]